jgi:hypothetical protein
MRGYLYDNHIPELQSLTSNNFLMEKSCIVFNTYKLILYDYLY